MHKTLPWSGGTKARRNDPKVFTNNIIDIPAVCCWINLFTTKRTKIQPVTNEKHSIHRQFQYWLFRLTLHPTLLLISQSSTTGTRQTGQEVYRLEAMRGKSWWVQYYLYVKPVLSESVLSWEPLRSNPTVKLDSADDKISTEPETQVTVLVGFVRTKRNLHLWRPEELWALDGQQLELMTKIEPSRPSTI